MGIIESVREFHAGHTCIPGTCKCRCGCDEEMGCTLGAITGDLCSVCHVRSIRGDDEHGPMVSAEVAAEAAHALSVIVHERCKDVPHDIGLALFDEVMRRFILLERED